MAEESTAAEADARAVLRVAGGESGAFRVLVERHQGRLLAFVRSITGDLGEAEDIAQEAFLAAYRSIAAFDARKGTFAAWLFRIARNRALNAVKRKRPSPVAEVPDRAAPEGAGEADETFRRLDAALAGLPADQRRAFVLAAIQDFSYEEVGRIEEVPVGTVRSRVARAREKLRTAFAERRECG